MAAKSEKSMPSQQMRGPTRHRQSQLSDVWSFIVWLVGVLVSLAVGTGMSDGTLQIFFVHEVITKLAGWVVIILALLGVLLKIVDKVSK